MNRGGLHISRRLAAGLAAVVVLAIPAQASAATVGVIGDTLAIGGGSESSTLTVTRSGTNLVVTDAALTLTEGNSCIRKPKGVVCPAAGVTKLVAVLLDGADSLDSSAVSLATTFYGGNGNDVVIAGPLADSLFGDGGDDLLNGGAGTDSFYAGAGNDVLLARDGRAEAVACGDGDDSGTADLADALAADCESAVERPVVDVAPIEPPPGEQPPAHQPPPEQPPAAQAPVTGGAVQPAGQTGDAPVTIQTPPTVELSSRGELAIGVACNAAAGTCAGSIEIVEDDGVVKARTQVTTARRGKRVSHKGIVLGRAKFSVAAGQTEEVTVRLSRGGRQRIIKNKRRGTRAKIVITVQAPDGSITTSVKAVSIRPAAERRTIGRTKHPKTPPKGGRRR